LHWGHDISPAENPFEANLGFAVKLNKERLGVLVHLTL